MDAVTKPEKQDWLSSHLLFLKGLKSPTEAQQLFLLLAVKKEKTAKEQKTFDVLVKSEKAAEKAKAARSAVSSMLSSAKKEEGAAERKARTHKLVLNGLLFEYSGIAHLSRAELLGLLIAGALSPPNLIKEWSARGVAMLAVKEPVKAAPAVTQ